MSQTKTFHRVLAPVIAVLTALAAITALSLATVPAAEAAPKVKIKTKAPYKKNQTIKVKLSGFPANAQIAVGVCPTKSNPKGPGDCGSPGKGYSRLTVTNSKGKLTTTLKVPKGKLGATLRPSAKCNNKKKNKCSVHASSIGGKIVSAKTKALNYA